MKKIILSSLFVLAVSFTYAQKAEFGVKGGLNVANQNYSGDGSPSPSSIIGFNVGGFAEFKISEKFSIQPELLYSTQGSKFSENLFIDGDEYNVDATLKMAYINIPVMFKYYVADKFNLAAGPQIGFLTSCKMKVEAMGLSETEDVKDSFESIDFGLNIGVGYDFTEKLSAGIRYNFGLSNVAKTEAGDDSEIKNSVFSLSVGYKF